MNDWKADLENALNVFAIVASLARASIRRQDMEVQHLEAPHKSPSGLPKGKMAVYGFWYSGEWLKVGMAGPKSNARYTSQHYSPNSAASTLAGSLLKSSGISERAHFNRDTVGDWIKSNCHRVNILLNSNHGMLLLRLLESFLHLYLRPRYEK
jgi:hypothetical protein